MRNGGGEADFGGVCLLAYIKLLEVWDGAEGEKKEQPPGPGVTGQFLVLHEALSRLRI